MARRTKTAHYAYAAPRGAVTARPVPRAAHGAPRVRTATGAASSLSARRYGVPALGRAGMARGYRGLQAPPALGSYSWGPYQRIAAPSGIRGGYQMGVGPGVGGPYKGQSGGAYGDAGGGITGLLDQYAPAVNAVVQNLTDPRKDAARLRAALDNARARGASPAKIRRLEEQLKAAEAMVADREASISEGQRWQEGVTRNLWVVTAIGVGVVALLGAATYTTARRSKRGAR